MNKIINWLTMFCLIFSCKLYAVEFKNVVEWMECPISPKRLESGDLYRWFRTVNATSAMTLNIDKDQNIIDIKIYDGNDIVFNSSWKDNSPVQAGNERVVVEKFNPAVPLLHMQPDEVIWLFYDKNIGVTYIVPIVKRKNKYEYDNDVNRAKIDEIILLRNYVSVDKNSKK